VSEWQPYVFIKKHLECEEKKEITIVEMHFGKLLFKHTEVLVRMIKRNIV
jgi:hypothetical protein